MNTGHLKTLQFHLKISNFLVIITVKITENTYH